MSEQAALTVFVVLALSSQVVLVAYFAALRWWRRFADRFGWVVYAMGLPSLVVGAVFVATGRPLSQTVGPFLFAAWAAFGYQVDLRRPASWRHPPRWSILIPYVGLMWVGIFGLWMPLRNIDVAYFVVFGVMLVVHSVLNVSGHVKRS